MSEWVTNKLGNLISSVSETYNFSNIKKVVFLNTSDIYLGKVLKHNYDLVKNLPGQAKKKIKKNDFLFSEIRPANGRFALVDFNSNDYVVSTKLMVLRCGKQIHSNFLRYLLTENNMLEYLQNIAESRSGTFPQITFDQISDIKINIPSVPEQHAIAEVLSSLDDKIDLLSRQNKSLEALASTYFHQWFIEEANNEWEKKGLDEIAIFLNGLALQKYPCKQGEPLLVIKIKELNDGFSDNSDICSADIPEKYIVNPGDVVFSWSGSLVVDIWKYGRGALNQHLFKVTSDEYPKWFYYYWIQEHLKEFKIIAESKATTMGHIQRGHLTAAKVLVPRKPEIDEMSVIMNPLIKKIEQNNLQLGTLKKLRDTLLPKLISGEARVAI